MADAARAKSSGLWLPGVGDPWPANRDWGVVVVDPDPQTRAFYRTSLESAGYTVDESADGPKALELIERVQPQLVVVDGAVGNQAVLDWAERLKANQYTCDIPVLLVVPGAQPEISGTLEATVDECLTSPIRDWELLLRVRSMIRLRHYRLELAESRGLHGEQTRMWGVLLDFSRSVGTFIGQDALLEQIVRTAAEMTSSRRVSLMLPDEEQQHLTIARSIGLDEKIARDVRVPIGEAISGQAFLSGRPVTDLDEGGPSVRRTGYGFKSFVSMPMIYTTMNMVHQRVGVINVANRYSDQAFEEWELEFIDLLGSISASAIDDIDARAARESLLRIERDLQVARRIQRSTFPRVLPALHGFEIDAWSEPAEETGGDTYDVIGFRGNGREGPVQFSTDDADRAILLLADATGHGIGPALSVTQVRAMLRMAVRMQTELTKIAAHMNEQLGADLPGGRFVTAWLGELNAADNSLVSFSAGQAPILHYQAATDRHHILPADTMPLGIADSLDMALGEPIALSPGDIVAVISDGMLEAMDPSGEQFGPDRTMEVISAHRGQRPIRIRAALRRAVAAFSGGAPAADDRTAIIIKCLER
ncbi:MAG: SpoIIE family protein phosphatase [Planctomycetota bacterium]|jgi:phosphoserine phosphatase